MTIRLDALLRLPALAALRRIAGTADPEIDVVTACAAVAVGALPATAGKAAMVVLLDTAPPVDWRLDALLRRLADRGVRCVVVQDVAAVDVATTRLADRLSLVLVSAPDAWSASVAVRDALDATGLPIVRMLERLTAVLDESGPDIETALRAAATVLGRPLELVDADGVVRLSNDHGSAPAQSPGFPAPSGGRLEALPVATGVVLTAPVLPERPISLWLRAVAEAGVPADVALLRGVLPVLAALLGQRVARRRIDEERAARWRIGLLSRLLESSEVPPDALTASAYELGWPLAGHHLAASVEARADAEVIQEAYGIRAALAAEQLDAIVVEQTDGWALWTTWDIEPRAAEVAEAAARIRRAHQRWNTRLASQVGVGRVHGGLNGLRSSLAEARGAVRLAAVRPRSGNFVHVETLTPAQVLLARAETGLTAGAAAELLEPISTQHTGDLLRTLGAYLDAESSITETAAVLGVHRNTVGERIQRIERLLEASLDDSESRLALHFACRLLLAAD